MRLVTCFEYRIGGRGRRRGFIHDTPACSSCEGKYGKVYNMDGHLRVQVPAADLADEKCVVCQQPMVPA